MIFMTPPQHVFPTRPPLPVSSQSHSSARTRTHVYLGGDFLCLFGADASRLFGRARFVGLALRGGLSLRGDLGAVRLQGGGGAQTLSG
jgi:hypothetical protein